MRIRYRNKSKLNIQRIGAVVGLLIPIAVFGSIAGQVANMFNEIPKFGTDESLRPDPSTFLPANYTRLAQMANFYDNRFEHYHIPNNYTTGTKFIGTNATVDYYDFSDNGALWTGSSIVAFVGKYLTAINESNALMKNESLRVIRKLVNGTAMMLAVPNGGLGGDYGATVARCWAAPWQKNNASFRDIQIFHMNNKKYANGTGIYSQYRWSDDTSNDEYGGFYMGTAIAYKFVREADAPDVHATLALMIDQIVAGMLRSNFLGIGSNGRPTGVDQKMKLFSGATWTLLVLKMGALAFPEKYASIYQHYALEEMNAYYGIKESGTQEIVSNYFAFNFGIDICFALAMLEDDPVFLQKYMKNFEDTLWYCVRYHRNPYFDAMYLAMKRTGYGNNEFVERDVEDQLMEFDINHFPDVHKNPVPVNSSIYKIVNFSRYQAFFNTSVGALFGPVFEEFHLNGLFYDHPLTVKMKKTGVFMWDRNPFEVDENAADTDFMKEEPGMSFTAPYYIMTGFLHMPTNGEVRSAWSG